MSSLLSENLNEAKLALSQNFMWGFICSAPMSENEDRTVLVLARMD